MEEGEWPYTMAALAMQKESLLFIGYEDGWAQSRSGNLRGENCYPDYPACSVYGVYWLHYTHY